MSDKPIAVIGTHVNKGGYYEMAHEHKGDVMQRREWTMERLPVHGYRIYDEDGSVVAPDVYRQDYAEQIISDHNQHTTLVEQRDLLVAALRFLLKDYEQTYRDLTDGQFEFSGTAIKQAQRALATVEQGHGEQAGGGE